MVIFGYILVGVLFLAMAACAITPMIGNMSDEEKEAAGISWKEN